MALPIRMRRKGIVTIQLEDGQLKVAFTAEVECNLDPETKQLAVAVKLLSLSVDGVEADAKQVPAKLIHAITNAIADQAAADFPVSDGAD